MSDGYHAYAGLRFSGEYERCVMLEESAFIHSSWKTCMQQLALMLFI
jgi:hypothetical protein